MGHGSGHGRHSHHDHGDNEQYVTGGTNWESYELPQLISMVNDKVDIPSLLELADDWRHAGDEVVTAARDLGRALDDLMDFWTGAAAEQARTDVALNAQWVSDLGSTAHDIGTPVEESAGALKAAQDQMPEISGTPTVIPGSAPNGAAEGRLAAGPLGEAIGGVAEGSQSAAQAAETEVQLKRQAVETMQRFEAAAISIDQAIPQFEGRSTVLHPEKPAREPVTTTVTLTTDTTLNWQQLTGQHPGGTAAQGVHEHSGGAGGAGGGGGGGFGGGHAVPIGVGGLGSATGMGGGRASGTGSGAGATPNVERAPGGLAAAAGAMPMDPDGHPGMAGGGGAPMGGMGAGAAGGGGAGDHRRRFPFEADDPFTLDEKASPPVIGL